MQKLIPTSKVLVVEREGKIEITPVSATEDCTSEVRGMFAKYDTMTVDKFLERKLAEKDEKLCFGCLCFAPVHLYSFESVVLDNEQRIIFTSHK